MIQPTFALVRAVRGDQSWDINCPIPPAYCMLGLLACSEAYELGQLELGCPDSGNKYTVPKADESFFKKNQRHLSHFLWLPEASVSGCGDKSWPASSSTCLYVEYSVVMRGAWPGTL